MWLGYDRECQDTPGGILWKTDRVNILGVIFRNKGTAADNLVGGGPGVVVSTAAFHARVWGSVPGLGGLKEAKMFLHHPCVKISIVGGLRDRKVACSVSDRQGSNFESCVWRTVSSHHLTILRRFSWPSLAYMSTKVALSPIHFISLR